MELKKVLKKAVFLDPFNGFKPGGRECEIRTDPFTGRNSRILFFPLRELPVAGYEQILKKDTGFCPFCPENVEKITPKFNPELFSMERYRSGQAVCFPNAFPYDENGAVTVITPEHFVGIDSFTCALIADAFSCCVEYLKDVSLKQPEAVFQSINWNFLPLAGSSIIHPHLQVTASAVATNYYNDILKTAGALNGNIFKSLVDYEKEAGERFLSDDGYFSWIAAFAPQGVFDVLAISSGYIEPGDLNSRRLDALVGGILKVLKFIASMQMISFNLSLFFVIGERGFTPHLRMCPRTNLPPLDTSEINYMKMIHNEPMSTLKPEDVAAELKKSW
ncbi:MAG TPA: hypothetical protein PK514_10230 [Spirochaetota bacterium]|nr:hypothetical protein [Spirochaetota bacterium]